MDFAFTDEQEAVAEAAAAVFAGMAGTDRVRSVEASESRVDDTLWSALAQANLIGIAVPEEQGGSGLGLTELCLVLEHQGRHVAPVPLWATAVLGALPVSRFGSPALRSELLPAVASGELRMSAALTESGSGVAGRPTVRAERDGSAPDGSARWRLHGTTQAVPQAHVAGRVIVPAISPDGVIVSVIDPAAAGVELERALTTDRQVHPHMHFDGAVVEAGSVLAGPGRSGDGESVLAWMLERARTGLCALALGVAEEALRRAAAYLNERNQFGRPLSSFQGTMLRAADAYIDTEAIRMTTWNAAWRIDTGRPAAQAVAVAKWWASEAGQRVVHATQHLHGGLGADVDYPIHRYFLWGKQIELMLDGPSAQLGTLGTLLSEDLKGRGPS